MQEAVSSRARLGEWVESARIQRLIVALIVVNAVTLGLETSSAVMDRIGPLLIRLDRIILSVFVLEIGVKLIAHGYRFFRSPWNVFDFFVVGIALVPAAGAFAVLRTLRILRVLRLISTMPKLRFIVEALLRAIPGISAIAGLLAIIFYVFAVMATSLFGASFPDWFGSVPASLYTLFQIMTLESWSMGIVRPVMEVYPQAWLFFVPFILIATFTMLNLFIAIIVDTIQTMHAADHRLDRDHIEATVHDEASQLESEIRSLRAEMRELRSSLERRGA
ncbi:MAG: ion transporter [Pseudomonadales bacterium]